MASITRCGTCVPPGPSRKTAGCLLIVCASAGNCERTQARSSAVDEEEEDEEACSAIGIADILNESVVSARAVTGLYPVPAGQSPATTQPLRYWMPTPKGAAISEKFGSAEAMP